MSDIDEGVKMKMLSKFPLKAKANEGLMLQKHFLSMLHCVGKQTKECLGKIQSQCLFSISQMLPSLRTCSSYVEDKHQFDCNPI